MKKILVLVLISSTLVSCSKSDTANSSCKFLLNVGVNLSINLSLPQYNQLQFAGNSVYVANAGNGGIIVASTGVDFFAWDASDPNHAQSPCSRLVNSGLDATAAAPMKIPIV